MEKYRNYVAPVAISAAIGLFLLWEGSMLGLPGMAVAIGEFACGASIGCMMGDAIRAGISEERNG